MRKSRPADDTMTSEPLEVSLAPPTRADDRHDRGGEVDAHRVAIEETWPIYLCLEGRKWRAVDSSR